MVPDDPVWIEARAVVLDPESRLFGGVGGFAARSDRMRLGAIGGEPHEDLLREAFSDIGQAGSDPAALWAVVAPEGFTPQSRAALAGWSSDEAEIFREGDAGVVPARRVSADVRMIRRGEENLLEGLPRELGVELADALERTEIAAAWVGGRPVSFCYVACESDTLWDVSINTVPAHRRRGLAGAVAAWLAGRKSREGKRAVWGAHSGNVASQRLARSLGFEPWGRLYLFENAPVALDTGN